MNDPSPLFDPHADPYESWLYVLVNSDLFGPETQARAAFLAGYACGFDMAVSPVGRALHALLIEPGTVNKLLTATLNDLPSPCPPDSNASHHPLPRPDLIVCDSYNGEPVYQHVSAAGIMLALLDGTGRFLQSTKNCTLHRVPFCLTLDPKDVTWRHGRGTERHVWEGWQ